MTLLASIQAAPPEVVGQWLGNVSIWELTPDRRLFVSGRVG
jgi:hypothetical protein